MLTRRDFGRLALAAAPFALRAAPGGTVRIGVATDSFHELPRTPGRDNVDDIIRALKAVGATEIDLASLNTEAPNPDPGLPSAPPPGPYGGPPAGFTPSELAARARALRDNLRTWRLATPATHYAELKAKFDAAGIAVHAMSFDHDYVFTNEEIDATFAHAKALGVQVITSRSAPPTVRRMATFAEKHTIPLAFRNDRETAEELCALTSYSSWIRVALDIGNFTAANQDAVAYLRENHEMISHLFIKDRTRNGGGNEVFGSGDAPVKPMLELLRERNYPIPAFVDYEYVGLGTPVEEVRNCLTYLKAALT